MEGKPIKDEQLHFDTWTDWENACAFSRLWGGMHFKDAVVDGLKLGHQFAPPAIDFVNRKINPLVNPQNLKIPLIELRPCEARPENSSQYLYV